MTETNSLTTKNASLKKYVEFILQDCLDEATRKSIEIAKDYDIQLLKQLAHLTPEELFHISKESLKTFLFGVKEDKVVEQTKESMEKWKQNKLDHIQKQNIVLGDLILVNSTRKRMFLTLLPKYSSSPEEIIEIATSIETLYAQLEMISLNTYVEIQEEDLLSLNHNLKEYQEELQVANEELRESHEELQATNEELREQIEIRNEIEEALEKESGFLKAVLENVSDAIVACNEFGILIFFNKSARELHGVTEEALAPDQWASYYNLYLADGVTLMKTEDVPLYKVFRGEEVKNHEMVIVPSGKSKKIVLASGERIFNSEGKQAGAVIVMRDITEFKAAHEMEAKLTAKEAARLAAEKQKESFEKLLVNAPLPIAILKREEFTFSFINKEYQERFFPGKQLVNKPLLKALPELKGSAILDVISGVLDSGEPFIGNEVPLVLDRGNGSLQTSYFNFVYEPIFSEDGGIPEGIFAVAYEVTDQVIARKAVEESEYTLRLALEAGKMGTWMLDLVNDTSKRSLQHDEIFGYSSLLPSWGYHQFISHVIPEDKEKVEEAFVLAGKTGFLTLEIRIKKATGETIWILIKGQTFFTGDKPSSMAGVVIDITDIKNIELKLQKTKEELATSNTELANTIEKLTAANEQIQSNMEKLDSTNQELRRINADLDNFIYTASHDLKAPIANIEGLVGVLSRSLSPDNKIKVEKLISLIEASIDRFKKTINDLTDIVKLQKEDDASNSNQLSEIIDEVRFDLENIITESNADIQVDIPDPCFITFSRKNLKSIIYNLLSNAIKYRSPERTPQIKISVQEESNFLRLTVKDNGLGMDLTDQTKIFSMFKRLHNHVEGSGIGLYIVKRIIDNSGGKIEVESRKGEGSTFHVFFKRS